LKACAILALVERFTVLATLFFQQYRGQGQSSRSSPFPWSGGSSGSSGDSGGAIFALLGIVVLIAIPVGGYFAIKVSIPLFKRLLDLLVRNPKAALLVAIMAGGAGAGGTHEAMHAHAHPGHEGEGGWLLLFWVAIACFSITLMTGACSFTGMYRTRNANFWWLKRKLRSTVSKKRVEALYALGELQTPEAIAVLLKTISDPDNEIRRKALGLLGAIKVQEVIEPAIQVLKDQDPDFRAEAARTLGELQARNAIPPLLDALKDSSFFVQRTAIDALARIGDPSTVAPILEKMLEGKKYDVSIEMALNKLNPQWQRLKEARPLMKNLIHDIGQQNQRFSHEAISRLNAIDSNWKQSAEAKAELPSLLEQLHAHHGMDRQAAARTLGIIRDPAARPALLQMLKDEDYILRETARAALACLPSEEQIPTLPRKHRKSIRHQEKRKPKQPR
jgi:HEAT repeat protein